MGATPFGQEGPDVSYLRSDWLADLDFLEETITLWWAGRDRHADSDGANPAAVFSVLRTVDPAGDLWAGARALRDGLWALGDCHLRLAPSVMGAETGWLSGLVFAPTPEGPVLLWADPAISAYRAASVGDLLTAIDGVPAEKVLASLRLRPGSTPRQRYLFALQSLSHRDCLPGESPLPRRLSLTDARRRDLTFAPDWRVQDPAAPPPPAVRARRIDDRTGLIAMRSFACRDRTGQISDAEMARQLDAAFAGLAGCDRLVIDLRGNGGGRDEQARMLAARLTGAPLVWMRHAHPAPYGGQLGRFEDLILAPTATPQPARLRLLIDAGTASTAEICVAALAALPGTVLVGSPSGGAVGDPVEFRLPRSLLGVFVPVARYARPGTEAPIEGAGLVPDIEAAPGAFDLREGRDPVLDAALASFD